MAMPEEKVAPKGRMICSWCPPGSPTRDLGPSGTEEDSHGICKKCAKKFLGVDLDETVTSDDQG